MSSTPRPSLAPNTVTVPAPVPSGDTDIALAAGALNRTPGGAPRLVGRAAAFAVFAAAGLLFVTSATTAEGSQLRPESRDLPSLILNEESRVEDRTARVASLREEVDALSAGVVGPTTPEEQEGAAALASEARVDAASGPGIVVTLDDAPLDQPFPSDKVSVEDLIVHQQDVQAVVNALWAGGATNISLMGQQIISTSAVRCVGNTLRLQGRLYSPPYNITAIGDPDDLEDALAASNGVRKYKTYQQYGLGWDQEVEDDVTVPAYEGSLELQHATAVD